MRNNLLFQMYDGFSKNSNMDKKYLAYLCTYNDLRNETV